MNLARLRPATLRASHVFLVVTAVGACTCGDFGLTWDEPVYRASQQRAAIWFQDLFAARSLSDLEYVLSPQTLHQNWVYGRFGTNFHPPLAGLIDLATYETFGFVFRDIPARRMGAVLCLAGAATLLFSFMKSRHGTWTGLVSALCLVLTPRVFADGQIGSTDAPGLLFWPAAALAFWKAMYAPGARKSRVLTGICIGLAFLVKPVSMMVLLPIVVWYAASVLRPSRSRNWDAASVGDAVVTLGPLFGILGATLIEIKRLSAAMPSAKIHDVFIQRFPTSFPDGVLALPLLYWLFRRFLARAFSQSKLLGKERPALETLAAALAWAPLVVWLGNPLWWRYSIGRLAHYFSLGADRRSAVPAMPVLYFGETYLYNGPWESAWVWFAVTIPLSILAVEVLGLITLFGKSARIDRLPFFFFLNAATLPMLRALSIPGHDGTRLLLPSFFFLSAFGGWGALALARFVSARLVKNRERAVYAAVACLVALPAAFSLIRVHPYELSYYNEVLGGPRGAWRKGMELSYWWDALTPSSLKQVNEVLPKDARILIVNGLQHPFDYLETLQRLGELRPDVRFNVPDMNDFPHLLTLTADSKADAISRILFVLKPTWESAPRALDGARVLAIHDARNSAIAFCVQLLTDVLPDRELPPPPAPKAPPFVRKYVPFLARYWGDRSSDLPPLGVNDAVFEWAKREPESLRKAAAILAKADPKTRFLSDPDAQRLLNQLLRLDAVNWSYSKKAREASPWAIPLAVEVLIRHPDELRGVILRRGFTDPATIGGYLDRDLPQ